MSNPNEGADIDGQAERDEAEYQQGVAEVEAIQASFPPGPLRDAAYADLDRQLAEEGY